MEFGIFTNMYHPKHWRDGKVRTEHETLRNELEYIELCDRVGFKYSWSAEHHFLDEYSHLSASESFMAYAIARTERIHVGSAIMNITAPVNHPARIAERVAMLDHLSEGRFEFGTGRGSSSTEVYGFGIESMERTRELYDESLPQIVRMWDEDAYSYEGDSFSMPPRRVLPKPYTDPHPPIWVAAGSPGTFEKAARLGIGVLCFTLGTPDTLAPLVEIYKKNIEKAEPVGDYVNNNIMVTGDMLCLEDGDRARRIFAANNSKYHTGLVFKYLDSFPRPEGFPVWPDLPPDPTLEELRGGRQRRRELRRRPRRDREDRPELHRHRRRPAHVLVDRVRLRHGRAARVLRALRQDRHPAVRHRPGALHHPPTRGPVRRLLRHPLRR